MSKIYKNISEIVGSTPLLEISNFSKSNNCKSKIFAKLEYLNPAGSIKDRVAKQMIDDAEKAGILKENSVIIEPTSGNTGIGIAAIGVSKGYRVIITMPDTMSVERRKILSAYGAELVLTDGKKGMKGAIEKAEELAKQYENSFVAGQFVNPSNPKAHENTTGPEIWEDTDGNVDILVAGIGTGGTISGIGKYLKQKNPNIKIIGIEPYNSPFITKGVAGAHGLQGIGAGFIPDVLDTNIYDEIITIKEEDAYKMGRDIAVKEGILVGISSGAALFGALEVGKREENKNIVVILPDTGDRYLSTPMFE